MATSHAGPTPGPPEVHGELGMNDVSAAALAGMLTGRDTSGGVTWQVDPLCSVANMTTERLDRVHGRLSDGTPWSIVAKTLRPASDSPYWEFVPEPFRENVLRNLDWTDEPRVYECGLGDQLPTPLRMPQLFGTARTSDRITLWMEDVADTGEVGPERLVRAATALGRLAGRWSEQAAVERFGLDRRLMSELFFGKITNFDLALQSDPGFWQAPDVAGAVDERHRDDLFALADAMPALLERLDALPHGVAHGDAAPDNLREPGDGDLVAIDWSYGSVAPLGSDLAQLLAGAALCGDLPADALDEVADDLVAAFVGGLHDEGCDVDGALVEHAWVTTFTTRTTCSALLLDEPPEDPAAAAQLLARRAAVGRFGLDRAARLLGT
jgi:hypothetical protein